MDNAVEHHHFNNLPLCFFISLCPRYPAIASLACQFISFFPIVQSWVLSPFVMVTTC